MSFYSFLCLKVFQALGNTYNFSMFSFAFMLHTFALQCQVVKYVMVSSFYRCLLSGGLREKATTDSTESKVGIDSYPIPHGIFFLFL